MIGRHFSLILLPTNKCNVACEYCFEDKTSDFMSHAQLSIVIEKLLDHMERKAIAAMTIYWQGGEIMLLPPAWFERAHELIQKAADARGKRIAHSLQSNMIGYTPRWNKIIAEMFGNSVGTSMDFRTSTARPGTARQHSTPPLVAQRTARQAGHSGRRHRHPQQRHAPGGCRKVLYLLRGRAWDYRLSDQHLVLRRGAQ